jgi:hypothetical protein
VSRYDQPPPDPLGPDEAPRGFHYEWVVAGSEWRAASAQEYRERRCRRPGCKNPPEAALARAHYGRQGRWSVDWLYCREHLYGRRIEGGVVWQRRLVKDEAAEVAR